jgi:hypothetical protein
MTTLTSWPLPTIDDVIDTMAVSTSDPVTGKSS